MNQDKRFLKIQELLDDPKATAEDLAMVIAEDRIFAEDLINLIKIFLLSPVVRLSLKVR